MTTLYTVITSAYTECCDSVSVSVHQCGSGWCSGGTIIIAAAVIVISVTVCLRKRKNKFYLRL